MQGPDNFDFTNWYGKKDVPQSKNYVEITPEQQAEIDKANAAAEAARNSEALQQGLSNKQPDLDKGVSVQRTEPVRTDIGNGGTKITHPDGTVEFVFDYAKGYNGAPQLFEKGTKVTFLNEPAPEVISPGVNQDKIDEWGRQVSHGQIRHLGRGLNALGNVATFAFGAGIFAKAFKGASFVSNILKGGKTFVQSLNSAAVKGGGTLIGAAALASCSKEDFTPELPHTSVEVFTTNKQMVDHVVNYLNDPNNEHGFGLTTSDGVDFKYGCEEGYDGANDIVRPYITLGEGENRIKLPIDISPLQDLTPENIIDYINIIGGEFDTADNIDYNFRLNNDKAEVVFGNGDKTISLPLDPKGNINVKNVVDYINIIGDELSTTDGITYNFQIAGEKAQVAFDNGLTHTVGDDVRLDPNGTTYQLSSMLSSVGLTQPEQGSTKISMGLETALVGSYDGKDVPTFSMNIVTPADLKDITAGNPTVKGNFAHTDPMGSGEIFNYEFEGKTEQAAAGTLQLEVNGKTISNAQNGIIIKNANGDEIYMQKEPKFDLQYQGLEPNVDTYDNAVVVYIKEAGSDVFKEQYIMANIQDSGDRVDIGFIDRGEFGTTFQNYASTMTTFDTQGAIDADNYYKEKEGNLTTSYNDADNYYKEKEGNLNDAYTTADEHFREVYQYMFGAEADAGAKY